LAVQRAKQIADERGSTVAIAQDYLNDGAQLFSALGTTFHIPATTIQKVNTTVKVVTQVAGIVEGLASGNFLGAAEGVVGFIGDLFGGGGPDPDEQRHQEEMEALGNIQQQLDTVIALQRETLKEVAIVNAKLDTIARQMTRDKEAIF